jgi:hypothetical protein
MKEGEKESSLVIMGVAFRVKHALAKKSGLNRRDGSLAVVVLIRDQHMFNVSGMIQHIQGGISVPEKQSNDVSHWEFDHVAIALAMQ